MNISTRDECNTTNTDNLNNQTSTPREEQREQEESTEQQHYHHQDPEERPDEQGVADQIGTGKTEAASSHQVPATASPQLLYPTSRIPSQPTTVQPKTAVPISINNPPSVNAVRVLFRDQQLSRPATSLLISRGGSTSSSTPTTGNTTTITRTPTAPIVSANRRLIERQIEAIQEADSRRWNFDFINCRPLNQIGHRYVHQPRLQQWPSPTHQKGELQRHSDHKQDDG